MLRRVLLLLTICCAARAALTPITGTITYPDGSHPSGLMTIQSQAFTNAQGQLITAVNLRNLPIVNGVVSISLEPNIGATPQGTSYRVSYQFTGTVPYQRIWYVPVSVSPVPLEQVEFPIPGLVTPSAIVNPTQILQAGASIGNCLAWNGNRWAPSSSCGGGGGGSTAFNDLTNGTNTTALGLVVGSGAALTFSGTGVIDATKINHTALSGLATGILKNTTGTGVPSIANAGDFPILNQSTTGNATTATTAAGLTGKTFRGSGNTIPTITNAFGAGNCLNSLADGTLDASGLPINGNPSICIKADLTSFTPTPGSLTTWATGPLGGGPFLGQGIAVSTTPAASTVPETAGISTLASGWIPAVDLAGSGAGGVTGNLPVTRLNGGAGASSTTVWYGDGTWRSIAAGGTVTNTLGPLVAGALIVGNGGNDEAVLGSLGTATTVLHGNSGGSPSFGTVILTTDVSGILGSTNGGLGTSSIIFSGPSGGAKTFTLPNASATILTSNAAVTMAQGGTGADFSTIAKGGILTGTAAGTLGITAAGANGQILSADSTATGGVRWISSSGSGTVTSLATTTPITGGTITTTGTIACPTCVTSAASLTLNQIVIGGGGQASSTLGSLGTTITVLHGNAGGAPAFTSIVGADLPFPAPTTTGAVKSLDCAVSIGNNGAGISSINTDGTESCGQYFSAILNDTNVTGTGGPANQINLGWTGTLAVSRGGWGLGTLTAHALYVGNGTSAPAAVGLGTTGQVLTSNGPGVDPTFQSTSGTGSVTSVAETFTGGLISVAGSPITTSGTLALTVAGTSGGIPYFSGASTWASSGALTANLPVIGGGAGIAPTVGSRTGNTTQFATWTGATTASRCVHTDASGNLIIASADCGTSIQFGATCNSTTISSAGQTSVASGCTLGASLVLVYLDGTLLESGSGNDYTVSGNNILIDGTSYPSGLTAGRKVRVVQ